MNNFLFSVVTAQTKSSRLVNKSHAKKETEEQIQKCKDYLK